MAEPASGSWQALLTAVTQAVPPGGDVVGRIAVPAALVRQQSTLKDTN